MPIYFPRQTIGCECTFHTLEILPGIHIIANSNDPKSSLEEKRKLYFLNIGRAVKIYMSHTKNLRKSYYHFFILSRKE